MANDIGGCRRRQFLAIWVATSSKTSEIPQAILYEWLFDVKIRFRLAILESKRLNDKKLYNLCDSAVFCALHDQLASLGRHAQLTRCFSAVAELLV